MAIVGVSALVVQGPRLLMVRRGPDGAYPGRWSLPGGRLEEGEPLELAVRREVREETGLRVRVGPVVAAVTTPPREHSYVVICFRAEVTGGRLCAGSDAAEAEWVPLRDAHRRRTTPRLREILSAAGLR